MASGQASVKVTTRLAIAFLRSWCWWWDSRGGSMGERLVACTHGLGISWFYCVPKTWAHAIWSNHLFSCVLCCTSMIWHTCKRRFFSKSSKEERSNFDFLGSVCHIYGTPIYCSCLNACPNVIWRKKNKTPTHAHVFGANHPFGKSLFFWGDHIKCVIKGHWWLTLSPGCVLGRLTVDSHDFSHRLGVPRKRWAFNCLGDQQKEIAVF